jgi:hypothetical protein
MEIKFMTIVNSIYKNQKKGQEWELAGFGASKYVEGKKHYVLADTLGFLLQALVHATNIQVTLSQSEERQS